MAEVFGIVLGALKMVDVATAICTSVASAGIIQRYSEATREVASLEEWVDNCSQISDGLAPRLLELKDLMLLQSPAFERVFPDQREVSWTAATPFQAMHLQNASTYTPKRTMRHQRLTSCQGYHLQFLRHPPTELVIASAAAWALSSAWILQRNKGRQKQGHSSQSKFLALALATYTLLALDGYIGYTCSNSYPVSLTTMPWLVSWALAGSSIVDAVCNSERRKKPTELDDDVNLSLARETSKG